MKILVTGGTGFVGSHLLDALLTKNDVEVYALVRQPTRLKGVEERSRLRILEGDLFSIPPLPSSIDVVFHLAGLTKATNSSDYYTVNQKGTASLFQSLLSQGIHPKIIHLSSLAAGGPSRPGEAVKEDDPPRPVSSYGNSKLRAEEEALKYKNHFPLILLRVAAVYGPGDKDFLVYFRLVKKGILPLIGSGKKLLSLCYITDVIRVMDLCLESHVSSGEVFNIADAKPYSWEEIGETAARIMGKKCVRLHIPPAALSLAASAAEVISRMTRKPVPLNRSKFKDMEQDGWVANVDKAKKLLGFETHWAFDKALEETIEWYVQHRQL